MKRYLLILVATLSLTACTDEWLETTNLNALDVSSFLTTKADMESAVNAAYTPLAHGGLFGQKYMYIMNSLDPDIWNEKSSSELEIMAINTIPSYNETYRDLYLGVWRTSDLLSNAYRVENEMTTAELNSFKGQIRALRGMYYFYLVTWFNKPIFYNETNLPSNPLTGFANGEPEQFWNQISSDLRFAAANLPASWATADKGRITKGAANAQLGKALLYKHFHYYLRNGLGGTAEAIANLDSAKTYLKAVINSGDYELMTPLASTKADYQAALLSNYSYLDVPAGANTYDSENNKESVWEIQYNDQPFNNFYQPAWLCGGSSNYVYSGTHTGGFRNHAINPSLWYKFETTTGHPAGYTRDPRAYATCYLEGDTMDWRPSSGYNIGFVGTVNAKDIVKPGTPQSLYTGLDVPPSNIIGLKKYSYPQFVNDGTNAAPYSAPYNIRVIRYADVLLMYAEVCLLADNDADGSGLAALNLVRARAGMPAQPALDRTVIMHEREVELACEGHRYNDIIRWYYDPAYGINAASLSTMFRGYFQIPKHLYFPIPQADIDANKGQLKQNPGW